MKTWPGALALSVTIGLVSVSGGSPPLPATSSRPVEAIAINDNRRAAGTTAGDVLTIRLEARSGQWHPDGDAKPGITVNAFGVEAGPLQIPAPLIRVTEGTEIRAIVRNRLDGQALAIHGCHYHESNRFCFHITSFIVG